MPTLRKNVIDQIYNVVETTYFGSDNYQITFPENGTVLVKIVFLAQPSYYFLINETYNNDGRVQTNEIPGEFKISDEYKELTINTAIERITKWANRVRQELTSTGVRSSEANDVFNQIDEYVKTLDNPSENFTKHEVEQIRSQLSDLQSKFEELLEKSTITEAELKRLKIQISSAENDLKVFNKDIWYKTSMRKIIGTTKAILTSKEGKEVALGIVKKMLSLE